MDKKPIGQRFIADLKENYLKTGIMFVLAGVFLMVWMPILLPDSESRTAGSSPSEPFIATASLKGVSTDSSGTATVRSGKALSLCPLAEAVPYEKIKRNPFDFSLKQKIESERETDASARTKKQGETLAEEEDRVLKTIKLTCTITGDNAPYAVLEGLILKEGDEYKGFKIKEIGEGYTVFSGQMVTRRIEVEY